MKQQRLMLCAKADDSPSVKRMGELQPNVNGNFRGARLSKGRREKQVIGCRKWWEVSCVRVGCIIRFFSRVECPGEFFFLLFSRGEIFRGCQINNGVSITHYLFSDLSCLS